MSDLPLVPHLWRPSSPPTASPSSAPAAIRASSATASMRNLTDPNTATPARSTRSTPRPTRSGAALLPRHRRRARPGGAGRADHPGRIGAGRRRGVRPARHQGGGGDLRRLPRGRAGRRGPASRRWSRSPQRYGMRIMGPNGIGVIDTHTPLNTTFVTGMPPPGTSPSCRNRARCAAASSTGPSAAASASAACSAWATRPMSTRPMSCPSWPPTRPARSSPSTWRMSRAGRRSWMRCARRPAASRCWRSRPGAPPAARPPPPRTPARWPASTRRSAPPASRPASSRSRASRRCSTARWRWPTSRCRPATASPSSPTPAGRPRWPPMRSKAAGLRLARTSAETQAALRSFLHPDAQVAGPVDMLGGADETTTAARWTAVLADPAVDGVLAILVPQLLVNPVAVVEAFGAAAAAQAQPRQAGAGLSDGRSQPGGGLRGRARGADSRLHLPGGCRGGVRHLVAAGAVAMAESPHARAATADSRQQASQRARQTRGAERDPAGQAAGSARSMRSRRAAAGGLRHRHAGRGAGDQPA